MILVFLMLFVTIPLTLTYLSRRFLFNKLTLSSFGTKAVLIFSYLGWTVVFVCCAIYFSFGPLFYGHRQASQFYNSNKTELLSLIKKFASLERQGLFSVNKSVENNLKITLELADGKGTTEFLVNDKKGKYEIVKMADYQSGLIYNPRQPASLREILNENKIAEDEFNNTLQLFRKTHVLSIQTSNEEYLIGIRETFLLQIAYLFFCKPESEDCNKDKGEWQIDKGVYFDKLSNP
jgi:hypothetical protein